MRIKNLALKIDNLLDINFVFEYDKPNVIYGENEAGKTSLLKFFRYLFFQNEKKVIPWFVSDFAANTVVHYNGVDYTINFDKGNVKAVPSEQIFIDINKLFDFETFKNSFAITQEELFKVEYFDLLKKKKELFLGVSGFSNFSSLTELIGKLKKDIDKLYKQRGRKPYINQLKEKLKKIEKEIDEAKEEILNVDFDLINKKSLEHEYINYKKRISNLKSEIKNIRDILTPFESYLEIRNKQQLICEISKKRVVDEKSFIKAKKLLDEIEDIKRLIDEKESRISVLKSEIEKNSYRVRKDLLDKFKKDYLLYGEYNPDKLFEEKKELEERIDSFIGNSEIDFDKISFFENEIKELLVDYKLLKESLKSYYKNKSEIESYLSTDDEDKLNETMFLLKKEKKDIEEKMSMILEKEKIEKEIDEVNKSLDGVDLEKLKDMAEKAKILNNNPLLSLDEKELDKIKNRLSKIRFMNFFLFGLSFTSTIFLTLTYKKYMYISVLPILALLLGYYYYTNILKKIRILSYKDFLKLFNELKSLQHLKNEDFYEVMKKISEIEHLEKEKMRLERELNKFAGIKENRSELDKKLFLIESKIDEIKQKLSELNFLKKEHKKLISEIENADKRLKEVEKRIKTFGFEYVDEKRILQSLEDLKKLVSKKEELEKLINEVNEFYAVVEKLKNELQIDKISLDELSELIDRMIAGKDYKLKLEGEYKLLEGELIKLNTKLNRLQDELEKVFIHFKVNDFEELEVGYENYKMLQRLEDEIRIRLYNFKKKFGIDYEGYLKKVKNFSETELQHSLNEKLNEMEELQYNLQKIIEKISRLDEKINIYQNKDILHQKENELEKVKEEFKLSLEQFAIKSISLKILENTLKRYEEEYQPELLKNSSKYFEKFTNERYRQVKTDIEGNIYVIDSDNSIKKVDELSAGTKDQLYLALRLGYIDLIDKDIKFPLFFDEVTANFDEIREKNFFETLKRISNERQVFIFTCKKSLFEQLKGDFATFNL